MAFTEDEKVERIKRILIERIGKAGPLSALKTLLGNLTLAKIKVLLDNGLQAEADACDVTIQGVTDEKGDILALKAEKDDY